MHVTEVILSQEEFALIQRVLMLRWNDEHIDREVKEAEGLKPLLDNLNLIKGPSGYLIRPISNPTQ
jgi:hypothetical protein